MKYPWLPFGFGKAAANDGGPRYADLYERGLACAVDITILFVVLHRLFDRLSARLYHLADHDHLVLARDASSGVEAFREAWAAGLPQLWMLNALIQLTVMGLFLVGCQYKWRTTPGKWLLGLSIRRAETLEEPAKWRYILRYIGYIPAAPLFFIMSFNKRHRGLHDRIADTVVIHTRPKDWYWLQIKRAFFWLKAKL